MRTQISKIIACPVVHHRRSLTVQGVVRTACETPFPHFTLEDKTGTIICESMTDLPGVGAHVEIDGEFCVDIPQTCSVQVPRLKERTRSYLMHQRPCGQVGCEFETEMPWRAYAFAA